MAKIMFGTAANLPIFFNIEGNVGDRCPNRSDDVALVSYLMRLSGRFAANAEAKRICEATPVTNQCTPELIQSIRNLQAALKVQVDSRISVASPSTNYATGAFLIARFNYLVKTGNKDLWPRIDKIPDAPTPPEVSMLIQAKLVGLN